MWMLGTLGSVLFLAILPNFTCLPTQSEAPIHKNNTAESLLLWFSCYFSAIAECACTFNTFKDRLPIEKSWQNNFQTHHLLFVSAWIQDSHVLYVLAAVNVWSVCVTLWVLSACSIIPTALLGTSVIFISFTVAALLNNNRTFLYMGGKGKLYAADNYFLLHVCYYYYN